MLLQTDFLPDKPESFSSFRYLLQHLNFRQGVVNPGDFLVAQHAGTANMSVDVAAGSAWVVGTSTARQGMYHQVNDALLSGIVVQPSNASNPRLDQVVLTINDSSVAGGSDTPVVQVLQGTATAGATLDNRNGAVSSFPANTVRLADILVPATSTSIVNSNIRDRRPWSNGYLYTSKRTSGNLTISNTSLAEIDTTNYKARVESSGIPLQVIFKPGYFFVSALNNNAIITLFVDGVEFSTQTRALMNAPAGTQVPGAYNEVIDNLPAGSHLISVAAAVSSGNLQLGGDSAYTGKFTLRELIGPNSNNNPAGYG